MCQRVGYPNSLKCIVCMTLVSVTLYRYYTNAPARSANKAGSINTLRHYGQCGQSASAHGTSHRCKVFVLTPLNMRQWRPFADADFCTRNMLFNSLLVVERWGLSQMLLPLQCRPACHPASSNSKRLYCIHTIMHSLDLSFTLWCIWSCTHLFFISFIHSSFQLFLYAFP